jgi:hypothetical protein
MVERWALIGLASLPRPDLELGGSGYRRVVSKYIGGLNTELDESRLVDLVHQDSEVMPDDSTETLARMKKWSKTYPS